MHSHRPVYRIGLLLNVVAGCYGNIHLRELTSYTSEADEIHGTFCDYRPCNAIRLRRLRGTEAMTTVLTKRVTL